MTIDPSRRHNNYWMIDLILKVPPAGSSFAGVQGKSGSLGGANVPGIVISPDSPGVDSIVHLPGRSMAGGSGGDAVAALNVNIAVANYLKQVVGQPAEAVCYRVQLKVMMLVVVVIRLAVAGVRTAVRRVPHDH
jgi:hypothetical protein